MTSPRTPRQLLGWTVPEHVHFSADEEHRDAVYLDCSKHENWPFTTVESGDPDPATHVGHFLRDHAHGEQIEYRPLSEVLPETPEPPQVGCCGACSGKGHVQGEACSDCLGSGHAHDPDDPCPTPEPPRPECECFVVPEEQWTRYGDATEPGSMLEPNPDCPVHFPASQSVPAVPVSSTGGKGDRRSSRDRDRGAEGRAECQGSGRSSPPVARHALQGQRVGIRLRLPVCPRTDRGVAGA